MRPKRSGLNYPKRRAIFDRHAHTLIRMSNAHSQSWLNRTKQRRFDRMLVESALPVGMLIEAAALCVQGRVLAGRIETATFCYLLEEQPNGIVFRISPERPAVTAVEELREAFMLMLGLYFWGANVRVEGKWSNYFPGRGVLQHTTHRPLDALVRQPLASNTQLTLQHLDSLHQYLHDTRPLRECMADGAFLEEFPSSVMHETLSGMLRHRSGHEVAVELSETGMVLAYSIDAPNPAERLLDVWQPNARKTVVTIAQQRRWSLANTLGQLPTACQRIVFPWVETVLAQLARYHESKGTSPLPTMLLTVGTLQIEANIQGEFAVR